MRLTHARIQNFRGLRDLSLDLDEVTVLLGENNSGKTAVMEALRLCLTEVRSRRGTAFHAYDFHLMDAAADPSSAEPIRITLTFAEHESGAWSAKVLRELTGVGVLQLDPDGRGQVTVRVTARYEPGPKEPAQTWEFLDLAGEPLPRAEPRALSVLQELVSYFYLSALRDASKQFDARGRFWRPFLKSSTLDATEKDALEAALKDVNDRIVRSHAGFDAARDKLAALQDIVPLSGGDVVAIDAIPGRIFDMLSRTVVSLGASTGAWVPVDRHGEGTQSLAVLMLFGAFLDISGMESAIVALEEPEAHLHPTAIRSLWKLIEKLPGQKIISTHSGDLVSEVPVSQVRRFSRGPNGTVAHQMAAGSLTPDQLRQFNIHVRAHRGELLFARCWLLVEGDTESILLPELARIAEIDLHRAGVRIVTYRHADVGTYLCAANALGVRWCVLADNDTQGTPDRAKVLEKLNGASATDVLFQMQEKDIEEYLCVHGFGAVYESYLNPQTARQVTCTKGEPSYWRQVLQAIKNARFYSKPDAALRVADLVREGEPAPPLLMDVLRAAVRLGGAG